MSANVPSQPSAQNANLLWALGFCVNFSSVHRAKNSPARVCYAGWGTGASDLTGQKREGECSDRRTPVPAQRPGEYPEAREVPLSVACA